MPSELDNLLSSDVSIKLSSAKKLILETLWSMEWIEGADIFKVINQTYYDRRIRELRESGWQIETRGTKYRLTSKIRLEGNERKYPNTKQKRAVFERDKGVCQICGSSDVNIQYDHKIPQERLGLTEVNNIQLLCRTCNVEKRGVCKRCTLSTCEGCPYAYPELYASRLVIFFDKEIKAQLQAESEQKGLPETNLIREIVSKHFKR